MKKILAFAGSTSSTSINKKLATFAAENLENTSFDVSDLPKGVYIFKILSVEGEAYKRIVRQ